MVQFPNSLDSNSTNALKKPQFWEADWEEISTFTAKLWAVSLRLPYLWSHSTTPRNLLQEDRTKTTLRSQGAVYNICKVFNLAEGPR